LASFFASFLASLLHDQRIDGDARIGGRWHTFDARNNIPRISVKVWTDEMV
jgi:hypothetical protein